jgi:hypothetical protein
VLTLKTDKVKPSAANPFHGFGVRIAEAATDDDLASE